MEAGRHSLSLSLSIVLTLPSHNHDRPENDFLSCIYIYETIKLPVMRKKGFNVYFFNFVVCTFCTCLPLMVAIICSCHEAMVSALQAQENPLPTHHCPVQAPFWMEEPHVSDPTPPGKTQTEHTPARLENSSTLSTHTHLFPSYPFPFSLPFASVLLLPIWVIQELTLALGGWETGGVGEAGQKHTPGRQAQGRDLKAFHTPSTRLWNFLTFHPWQTCLAGEEQTPFSSLCSMPMGRQHLHERVGTFGGEKRNREEGTHKTSLCARARTHMLAGWGTFCMPFLQRNWGRLREQRHACTKGTSKQTNMTPFSSPLSVFLLWLISSSISKQITNASITHVWPQ